VAASERDEIQPAGVLSGRTGSRHEEILERSPALDLERAAAEKA
jgi:hypothetical protein